MKIRKLHIKNYKVFNDLELDFTDADGQTLDKIVLAGVNGCGKTTILEIIMKMYDGTIFDYSREFEKTSLEVELEVTDSEKKIINSLNNGQEVVFYLKSTLSDTNNLQLIYHGNKSLNNNLDLFFTINNNISSKFLNQLLYLPINLNSKKKLIKGSPLQLIHLETSKKQMKYLAIKEVRDEIFKYQDTPPRQTIEHTIKEITKALIDMNLTTKLVDLESEELIFESANGQKIKFEELSSGEQNLYFRAIYLSKLNPKDSIIMIDEPEDSLHPTWQQKVINLYQNIGENNQVIVATHSPHIIGSSNADEVFLLEIDENAIEAVHPKYTKGHSIDYILEVMGANPRNTTVISAIDDYLALVRKGLHETEMGLKLKAEIDALDLDPNSAEMRRLDLSLKRFKAVGV